jgi:hypothetical protein
MPAQVSVAHTIQMHRAMGETGRRYVAADLRRGYADAAPATVGQCGPLQTPLFAVRGWEGRRSRLTSPETGLQPGRPCCRAPESKPIAGGGVRPDTRDLRVFRRTLFSALFDPTVRGCTAFAETPYVPVVSLAQRRVDFRCVCDHLHFRGESATHRRTDLADPVVVTAARSPQRLDQLLADVTVIGPNRPRRRSGLADLLQRQPGVQIVTNGGPGSTTGVFLRGANAGQTLVLIDGLRVSSSSSGTTPFEAIPLDQIDHIEILRGPAASLYGSDAIGGVIQVFTRKGGDTFAANASAGYGTYNTSQFAAGASGGGGPWRFMVQGGYNQSSGFNAIGNPDNFSYNPDRDGYRNGSASGSLAYTFAPEQTLSAQGF